MITNSKCGENNSINLESPSPKNTIFPQSKSPEKWAKLTQSPTIMPIAETDSQMIGPTSPTMYIKNIQYRMLSPQAPNDKVETMLEKIEWNNKFFPSKSNVCKGESKSNIQKITSQTNSPIVNYFSGLNSNKKWNNLYSPDSNYGGESPFYKCSNPFGVNNTQAMNISNNFNFSPSAIFNTYSKKSLSNSSLDRINNDNKNNNNEGIIMKTLQEKIEANLGIEDINIINETRKMSNISDDSCSLKKKHKISESKKVDEDISSENGSNSDNQELYMWSFNSDEDVNDGEGKDKKIKKEEYEKTITNKEIEALNNEDEDDSEENNNYHLNINDEDPKDNVFPEATLPKSQIITDIIKNDQSTVPNQTQEDTQWEEKWTDSGIKFDLKQPLENYIPKSFIQNNASTLSGSTFINDISPQLPLQQNSNFKVVNFYSNYVNNYYYSNNQIHPSEANFPWQPKNNIIQSQQRTIDQSNIIITTTANNKKIKRIDPQTYMNESYEYLSHNILLLAKDQVGCRFLQQKINDDSATATRYFYPALLPFIINLVKDPFGNYLIQKICGYISQEELQKILTIIGPNILDIGCNAHGTRVIQNIINYLKSHELINYFLSIITPFVIPLLKELNGTHIIQKFNTDFPNYSHVITEIVVSNCNSLATHRHGCCVLQKYLDGADNELNSRLINSILNNLLVLITDQFGNYVIQSIFMLRNVEASNRVAEWIVTNAPYYSKHKYSSNVVEKSFDYCDEKYRQRLIEVLSPQEIVNDLILDEHGNYVVQKVLAWSSPEKQNSLLKGIIPLLTQISNLNFGERVISRWLITYPQLTSVIGGKFPNNYASNIGNNMNSNNNYRGRYNNSTSNNNYNNSNNIYNKRKNYSNANNKGNFGKNKMKYSNVIKGKDEN